MPFPSIAAGFEIKTSGGPNPGRRCARALLLTLGLCANGLGPALSQGESPSAVPLPDASTGPTIRLEVDFDAFPGNPLAAFMYFVPLISPAPVSSVSSPGNTQAARVFSARRKSTPHTFVVTCEVEFTGDGSEQTVVDLEPSIRRNEQRLKAGGSTSRQLSSITIEGTGRGLVEVEGTISNNLETVTEVRLRFNAHGKTSPVSIELCELRQLGGKACRVHEIVARVNTLTFRRKPGTPKMEVTVASVKNKGAPNGLWQNVKGALKGLAVNLLIDPLTIERIGNAAMLDFGQALASGAATFTFPQATNLTLNSSPAQGP